MPGRLWPRVVRPLRLQIFLVLFAVALLTPVIGVAIYALQQMASYERAAIEDSVLQAAREYADDIDRELDRAFVTLETLATSEPLQRGDYERFHAQAIAALKRTKAAIVLVDRNYQQIVDTLKPFGEALPKTSDPSSAERVFATGQRHVSNLFYGSISGRPVFNVLIPIDGPDQKPSHVLIMSFQASYIADVLQKSQTRGPWISGVTDNNGIILARSQQQDRFVGQPLPAELLAQSRGATGVYQTKNVAGEWIARATVKSELAGWLISATVPIDYVNASQTRLTRFASVLSLLAIGLTILFAYVLGSVINRALSSTSAMAEAMGRGETVESFQTGVTETNRIAQTLRDASLELKKRHVQTEFLLGELAHRAKNLLAIIQGFIRQSASSAPSTSEFVSRISDRIQGLARSQDVLVSQNWEGGYIKDLVAAQIELFDAGTRVRIKGPNLFLTATATQNLGFALHELATNSRKYGAMSVKTGQIEIAWEQTGDSGVRFVWTESGVGPLSKPTRSGFGQRVITEFVPQALNGSAELAFNERGLTWSLQIPRENIKMDEHGS